MEQITKKATMVPKKTCRRNGKKKASGDEQIIKASTGWNGRKNMPVRRKKKQAAKEGENQAAWNPIRKNKPPTDGNRRKEGDTVTKYD
jgi:hypothetical protein